ncbi:MAG TPA: hypothetical protein PK129_10260, partial [Cellvibrionaceae bacterium]|nr:hypothetical protein [Cellvibrionaceae bacterium]
MANNVNSYPEDEQPFKLVCEYKPAGDQPEAIKQLVAGIDAGLAHQTLLG